MNNDLDKASLELHAKVGGKFEIASKVNLNTTYDLSLAYTPGVAAVSKAIAEDESRAYDLTLKKNTVAIVSDGSAVLGLGNIGASGAIPVMEGKAILFKEYAGLDAFPLCVRTQSSDEIIELVRNVAPVFAGINLEDISAPRCFEIEESLQDLGIPVFHDDQHGTAIVLLAALINAAKVADKKIEDLNLVINGAGAAGTAISELLLCSSQDPDKCASVRSIVVCDSRGIINRRRTDIQGNEAKQRLAQITNAENREGSLADAVRGADVFVGVSVGGVLSADMVRSMNPNPIVFAMANPTPEIMPQAAYDAGACVVGTGRSDFPNQVNNVLAFPGIFRGAVDARAKRISNEMKLAAAYALAESVKNPTADLVIPSPLDKSVAAKVAAAVYQAAQA